MAIGEPLSERSLSRIYAHWITHGFAALTSWRKVDPRTGDDVPLATNEARFRQLQQDISKEGFGYVTLESTWADGESEPPQQEPTLLIPAVKKDGSGSDPESLRELAKTWGRKYLQDAILFVMPDGRAEIIATTVEDFGKIEVSFAKFRASNVNWIWTQLRGRDRGLLESVSHLPPPTNAAALLRYYRGEIKPSSGPLEEASLSRLYSHWSESGFALVTAWRREHSEEQNRHRMRKLKHDIRRAGFGFIPLDMHVRARDEKEIRPVLLVPPHTVSPRGDGVEDPTLLREEVIKWGRKYGQENVIWTLPGGPIEVISSNGHVMRRAAQFAVGEAAAWLELPKGEAFHIAVFGPALTATTSPHSAHMM